MIRKQKTFLKDNVFIAFPPSYMLVRELADSIASLASFLSMWPERTSIDVNNRLKAILEPRGMRVGSAEVCLPGFYRASKYAERTETTIRVLPDDMVRFMKTPILIHMNFFKKNAQGPFYEIEFKVNGEDTRAPIYESHVVDHLAKEMRAEEASIRPFRPKE